MVDKKMMIKFAARCRDQDRQYEINNNCELDNGVYHKFVYSSEHEDDEGNPSKEASSKNQEYRDSGGVGGQDPENRTNLRIRQPDLEVLSSKMKQSTRNLNRQEDEDEDSF